MEPITKTHPIQFTAESVRAILDGRKTQTRRVVTPQPRLMGQYHGGDSWYWETSLSDAGYIRTNEYALRRWLVNGCSWTVGETLWVQEPHLIVPDTAGCTCNPNVTVSHDGCETSCVYGVDAARLGIDRFSHPAKMPRWASRIDIHVTGVRCERLQSISGEDAKSEGVECDTVSSWAGSTDESFYPEGFHGEGYRAGFKIIWDEIHTKKEKDGLTWDKNPWVWVIEFQMVE